MSRLSDDEERRIDALIAAFDDVHDTFAPQDVESFLKQQGVTDTVADVVRSHLIGLHEFQQRLDEGGSKPNVSVPKEIGPYRLISILGEGGMGVVWLAEQNEHHARRVALKLVRDVVPSGEFLKRFSRERRILARLDHPNIARIVDAGTTPEQIPFLVMEYVEGESLVAYCRKRRLTLLECLSLFLSLCDAIQHAHQTGVIHRDIKPSNVLVAEGREGPHVKVIDFGLAQVVDDASTIATTFASQFSTIVGSLPYMSPEQAAGAGRDELDERTDVFALGSVLFELLTGSTPIPVEVLSQGSRLAALQRVRDKPRPSVRARVKEVARQGLAGESETHRVPLPFRVTEFPRQLEWVVAKALQIKRAERYGSVASLAEDLRAFCEGRTIQAQPSVRARLRRFFTVLLHF